jgi:hypothetical protein
MHATKRAVAVFIAVRVAAHLFSPAWSGDEVSDDERELRSRAMRRSRV